MASPAHDIEAVLRESGPDFEEFSYERPGSGHHGEVFLVTLHHDGETYEVVVKFQPANSIDFALEPVLHDFVAERTDVPVPRILAFSEAPDIDVPPYFVTERVKGTNLVDSLSKLDAGVRERVVEQTGRILGDMHTDIGFEGFGRLALEDGRLAVADLSWDWQQYFQDMVDAIIEELAGTPFDDLRETAHEELENSIHVIECDEVPRLVHDDFRPANMLFDPDEEEPITAVLDWQFALAGAPEYHVARTDFLFIDPAFQDAETRERLRDRLHSGYQEFQEFEADEAYEQRRAVYHFATLLWRMTGFEAAFSESAGLAQARAKARFREQFEHIVAKLPTDD